MWPLWARIPSEDLDTDDDHDDHDDPDDHDDHDDHDYGTSQVAISLEAICFQIWTPGTEAPAHLPMEGSFPRSRPKKLDTSDHPMMYQKAFPRP